MFGGAGASPVSGECLFVCHHALALPLRDLESFLFLLFSGQVWSPVRFHHHCQYHRLANLQNLSGWSDTVALHGISLSLYLSAYVLKIVND